MDSIEQGLAAAKAKAEGADFPAGAAIPDQQVTSDDAISSKSSCELPTGYLDEDGGLHKTAFLKEITGEEEDILTSKKMPVHLRFQKILENCVTQIGPFKQTDKNWTKIIKSLVSTDRTFLVIEIRKVSLGSGFAFKVKCPEEDCGVIASQTVSLSDFKFMGMKDPTQRVWKGTLPKSKLSYTARVQTGVEEEKVSRLGPEQQKDLMSLAMMARIIELGGKQPVTLDMLKRLGLQDRQHLRDDFKAHEGDIDDDVEVPCPSCGVEFKTSIEIGHPSFFFPSVT